MGGLIQQTVQCDQCHGNYICLIKGKGTIIKDSDICGVCKGYTVIKESKSLEIDIPKGAEDHAKIVFQSEGDESPGFIAGDVIIEVQQQKHSIFTRKGADLIYNANISLLEALTGVNIVIPHINNRKINVKSKPEDIITPGNIFNNLRYN